MNIKVARNHYGRFEHDRLKLYLNRDDTFIVTPEIEESKAFQVGVKRGKFTVLVVDDLSVVEFAHGATEEMIEEARAFLGQVPEEPEPEPEPVVEEQPEVEEKPDEEDASKFVCEVEGCELKEPHEHPEEEEKPEEEPEKPPLAFTEIAGKVDNALKAISKETDKDKLNYALEQDERITVRKAINARLKELSE